MATNNFNNTNNNQNNPFSVPPIQLQRQQLSQVLTVSPTLLEKLQEKQLEYENLVLVKETSAQLAAHFTALAERLEELNGGCQAVANVLSNWQTVFKAVMMTETNSGFINPNINPSDSTQSTTQNREDQQSKNNHNNEDVSEEAKHKVQPSQSLLSSPQEAIEKNEQLSIPVLVRISTKKT
ncbi:hypothetical protein G9A89_002039 [Geosiphon pyriformis]|nr:hypothetical protein G9A89_002039 [Geosiphon pyriformis]